MKRNWQAEKARVEKEKADHAEERVAVFEIDFSSRRNEWRDDLWIDHKVEHGEISPVRGQERSHRSNLTSRAESAIHLNAAISRAKDQARRRAKSPACNDAWPVLSTVAIRWRRSRPN